MLCFLFLLFLLRLQPRLQPRLQLPLQPRLLLAIVLLLLELRCCFLKLEVELIYLTVAFLYLVL